MRHFLLLPAVLLLLPLASCSMQNTDGAPQVTFLGIATGTLATQFDSMQFRQRFEPTEHELIAVVGLDNVEDGTTVQATWFSPDDRRMPLGRTSINTASGATVARFQFKNADNWEPAPYMLDIRAFKQREDDEAPAVGSGQLHFFIGMDDGQIQSYLQEKQEYENREAEKRALQAEQDAQKEAIANIGRAHLQAQNAVVALEYDLDGDGETEMVVADTTGEEPLMPGGGGGVLLSHPIRQFAVVQSGAVLLSMRVQGNEKVIDGTDAHIDAAVQTSLLVLPSGTISLVWQEEGQTCGVDFSWNADAGAYSETARRC